MKKLGFLQMCFFNICENTVVLLSLENFKGGLGEFFYITLSMSKCLISMLTEIVSKKLKKFVIYGTEKTSIEFIF
jgi:hypothetical protein